MTDLDLAGLRRIADLTRAENLPIARRLLLELLDRIESLEAERDGANQRAGTLARAHDKEKARADRAEARLARVTDDSMAERIAKVVYDVDPDLQMWDGDKYLFHEEQNGYRKAKAIKASALALAMIRTAAADEQEASGG